VNALSLVGRIDVSNADQRAALCHGLAMSREALHAVVEALQPAIQDVRLDAMR